MSSPTAVTACIAEILASHGGHIDGLVTSAGFVENWDAVSYPVERMRRLWEVNVDGTWLFAVEVARHLVCPFPPPAPDVLDAGAGEVLMTT